MNDRINKKKTILIAFRKPGDADQLVHILSKEDYRVIKAQNFLGLIESLENYHIDLMVSEVALPGVSMFYFLPFLRKRYSDIKVIIAMKNYSPRAELLLRPYKVMYFLQWPADHSLLTSIIKAGLEARDTVYSDKYILSQ
ncbi:MAG: hypothetical protein ACOC7U_03350 [Spirochaetota bacterium]